MDVIFHLVMISLPFYILFAYNNIIDSIFYGIGKTEYMLFQSVFVNVTFYGTLFILFQKGIYVPYIGINHIDVRSRNCSRFIAHFCNVLVLIEERENSP